MPTDERAVALFFACLVKAAVETRTALAFAPMTAAQKRRTGLVADFQGVDLFHFQCSFS